MLKTRLIYITLTVIAPVVSSTRHCSKEYEQLAKAVDVSIYLLSKVKSDIPSCAEEENFARALDCADLYNRGINESGVYTIWPINRLNQEKPIDVYCDMSDGGGWTFITRMPFFNDEFDKDWTDYKNGFGDLKDLFWLGCDNLFMLTNQRLYTARYEKRFQNSEIREVVYCNFWIDDELNNYTQHTSNCRGEKGDIQEIKFNHLKFSTKDKDNDLVEDLNCAAKYKFGWWYPMCPDFPDGVSPPILDIKIRPSNFHQQKVDSEVTADNSELKC